MKNNNNKLITTVVVSVCSLLSALYLYAATMHYTPHQSAASKLGWISDPYAKNLCYGYFVEPLLDTSGAPILPPKQSPTTVTAGGPSTFSRKKPSVLTGHVVLLQPGRRVTADKAIIYHDPKTGKYKIIDLFGNIHAYEKGKLVVGETGHFDLINKTSTMKDVFYRVSLAPDIDVLHFAHTPRMIDHDHVEIIGGTGWGHAKTAVQTRPGHTFFRHVTYSTCAPDRVQWHVMATKLKLNKESGRGTAHNAMLFLGPVPVFYSPYFNFPISKKRKTGFLYPSMGYGNQSGAQLDVPFYWNMAPNYDDTITPVFYSKRGVLFKNLFRYLKPNSSGMIGAQFIANDREFAHFKKDAKEKYQKLTPAKQRPLQPSQARLHGASKNRYLLSWKDRSRLSRHWLSWIDYARASDDYFLQDFGNVPEVISTNRLLQKGEVEYADEHWLFTGIVQKYQTLHPINRQVMTNTYTMLPQLKLTGTFPNALHGLNLMWNSQVTYFTRTLINPRYQSINGGRFNIRPGVSLPLNWMWGYFVPTIQLDATQYNLQHQITGRPSHIFRTLPIINLHSGIYFDRQLTLHGHDYLQTLEPEIFYLYVPYHDQRAIPLFDSGLIPFDYMQLFSTNRFSGLDRMGDANQLSLALTTRFINNETGVEKFRFSIGQILYFRRRRVMRCGASSTNWKGAPAAFKKCNDYDLGFGAVSSKTHTSPIAALTSYHFNRYASINGAVAWDTHTNHAVTGSFYYSYSPALNHIINVGYSFIRNGNLMPSPLRATAGSKNDLSQIFVDGSWPITNHWSIVGIVDYNISHQHPQTYLAGLEYNTCCLRIRFVGGRTFSNLDRDGNFVFQNAFYLQIAFKGLGNVGTNSISNILASSIGGYVDPFIGQRAY